MQIVNCFVVDGVEWAHLACIEIETKQSKWLLELSVGIYTFTSTSLNHIYHLYYDWMR